MLLRRAAYLRLFCAYSRHAEIFELMSLHLLMPCRIFFMRCRHLSDELPDAVY